MAIHHGGNAFACDFFVFLWHQFLDADFLRQLLDGHGCRVVRVMLHGNCNLNQLRQVTFLHGFQSCDLEVALGQRAGFVEDNRLDLRHQFQLRHVLD